jgi:hypothetical protein
MYEYEVIRDRFASNINDQLRHARPFVSSQVAYSLLYSVRAPLFRPSITQFCTDMLTRKHDCNFEQVRDCSRSRDFWPRTALLVTRSDRPLTAEALALCTVHEGQRRIINFALTVE